MENEITQIDLFSCNKRFFNENNSWSLNYQSLPVIMSGLKMESSSSSSITFQSPETAFSSASTSDPEQRNSPISSCSDDENESENYSKGEVEQEDNPFRNKFRELRSRTSESLMRINRRTITKPKKLINQMKLSPNAIKKLYINSGKKLGRFKPSNLETIFEEPLEINTNDHQSNLLEKRKLKRSLSCSDGLNITKATIKSRRQKIKRIFGKRCALKKINLAEFKQKLDSSMEEWEDFHDNTDL